MNLKEFLDFSGVPKIRHYFCEFDDGLIFHCFEFSFFGSKGYTATLFHLESNNFQKCQKYKIWPTCISGHQFDIQIQVRLDGNHCLWDIRIFIPRNKPTFWSVSVVQQKNSLRYFKRNHCSIFQIPGISSEY